MNKSLILALGLLCTVGIGAEVIRNGQDCRKLFEQAKTTITRHHHHSPETLTKWAAWRKDHPGWKPKTRQESIAMIDWACPNVDLQTEEASLVLPMDLPIAPDTEIAPDTTGDSGEGSYGTGAYTRGPIFPPTTPDDTDSTDSTDTSEWGGGGGGYPITFWGITSPLGPVGGAGAVPPPISPPVVPPTPPSPPVVPEPPAIAMLATGLIAMAMRSRWR